MSRTTPLSEEKKAAQKAYMRAWYQANKERWRVYNERAKQKNPLWKEQATARAKAWAKRNPKDTQWNGSPASRQRPSESV